PLRCSSPALFMLVVNLPTPGAGFASAKFNELLEALQVSFDARRDYSQGIADLVDNSLGIIFDLQHDARLIGVEAMNRDYARIVRTAGALPRNAVIRNLLGNARVPRLLLPTDLRPEVQSSVVELGDFPDTLHELWKLFELRPLIVRRSDRDI